jgi:hypothetical protein
MQQSMFERAVLRLFSSDLNLKWQCTETTNVYWNAIPEHDYTPLVLHKVFKVRVVNDSMLTTRATLHKHPAGQLKQYRKLQKSK